LQARVSLRRVDRAIGGGAGGGGGPAAKHRLRREARVQVHRHGRPRALGVDEPDGKVPELETGRGPGLAPAPAPAL